MQAVYENNIFMPSDALTTPQLAFMYHRYLVASESWDVTPLSFNTGTFQQGVEFGLNNNSNGLIRLLYNTAEALQDNVSKRYVEEMGNHILDISNYLQDYISAVIPHARYYHCQIRDWGSRSIWLTLSPKHQAMASPYYY